MKKIKKVLISSLEFLIVCGLLLVAGFLVVFPIIQAEKEDVRREAETQVRSLITIWGDSSEEVPSAMIPDHWGSPFVFSILPTGAHEVRSLGPDCELNTADDIYERR